MSEKTFEIILEVKDIPFPSKVRKLTGERIYTLTKGLPVNIHLENEDVKFDNSGFKDIWFISDNGNINAISENKKLVWVTNEENAYWYFRQFDQKYDDEYEDK